MTPDEAATLEQVRLENQALRAQVAALEAVIAQLPTERQALREQLDAAQRSGARQAAPSRRRDSKKIPEDQKERPGRKPGPPGAYRRVPAQIDEHADVPLEGCPCWGGPLTQVEPVEPSLEELPPCRPHVTRIVTDKGIGPRCGEVHSEHPLPRSAAAGAAQAQLGPRAVALAAALNKQCGLTPRTCPRVRALLGGLHVTPGGLTQAPERAATKSESVDGQLIDEVRRRAAVVADETSWYLGAPGYWLWDFVTATTTIDVIDPHRSHDIPLRILGADFAGMLVSECLKSYDPLPSRKHKGVGHHQKAIAQARDRPDTLDRDDLQPWALLFTMVSVLWRHRAALGEAEFLGQRAHLESWCDRLLAEARTQAGDVAIQERLRNQRGSLFGCLYEPAAEPTNNRAERGFRRAVMTRELSCGDKTEAGKRCFEVLAGVARTCAQRGHEFVPYRTKFLPKSVSPEPIPAPEPLPAPAATR